MLDEYRFIGEHQLETSVSLTDPGAAIAVFVYAASRQ